jgi:hypothetical protein
VKGNLQLIYIHIVRGWVATEGKDVKGIQASMTFCHYKGRKGVFRPYMIMGDDAEEDKEEVMCKCGK